MSKSGLQKIIEKAMQKGSQPEPRSETAPEPVAKTPAEIEQAARTEHQNVVSKLRHTRAQLAGHEVDLLGIESRIASALSHDARGRKTYTKEAREVDGSRRDTLAAAISEEKKAIETLEATEKEAARTRVRAEADFLLSEIRRHEGYCGELQDRLLSWRDLGLALFQELKVESKAAEVCGRDYVKACQAANRFGETFGIPQLLTAWRLSVGTLHGQQ